MYFRCGIVVAAIFSCPAAAQTADLERITEASRVLPRRECPATRGPDEIVVCGRSRPDAYRIPEELRGMDAPTERSWSSQVQGFMESERTSGQTVGAAGALKYTQQMGREWQEDRARTKREKRALDRALDAQ
ncbi:MAG TPA: hypothetical protein VEZ70_06835 [Allosphingosinicella sp.]|nr:hypothetical protein [Allosphingosinicella sp.]